tara:strand:- start:464 stop:703 length:240 start_codon:yes stop_codon:yes gene_type:complete
MKKSWVSGLEEDQKKLMEGYFNGSPLLRERLKYILEGKISNRTTACEKLETYESPSWAYIQADKNGYNRAIREIMELIE